MEARYYVTCLWPGLAELWWRGRLSGLPAAVASRAGIQPVSRRSLPLSPVDCRWLGLDRLLGWAAGLDFLRGSQRSRASRVDRPADRL